MIELGCETAVNLDGGGSSVIYVRQPGKDADAVIQSSPSSGSERKVANGILLVYKENAGSSVEHLNVYPELTLAMPGAKVQLNTYASNELYEKTSLSGSVKYSVEDSAYGAVDESGIFTAGSKTGRAVIEAKSGNSTGYTEVEIVDDIIIVPSVTKLTIESGETRDINVTALCWRLRRIGASKFQRRPLHIQMR